jgi:hypothetical protein
VRCALSRYLLASFSSKSHPHIVIAQSLNVRYFWPRRLLSPQHCPGRKFKINWKVVTIHR